MTEDEAKTKACHRTLHWVSGSESMTWSPQPCIASACMAWRWRYVQTNKTPGACSFPQIEPIYERTEDGHCGLAGSFGSYP